MTRALDVLAPIPAPDPALPPASRPLPPRLALHLAADTVLERTMALADLPDGAELHVVVGYANLRLTWTGGRPGERVFAAVRPRLMLAVGRGSARADFEEALGLVERRTDPGTWRTIGIEAGGPPRLPRARRVEPESGRPRVDSIDPESLVLALPALAGQTAVVSGRVEGEALHFQAPALRELSLPLAGLVAAAEAADINLVVVRSSSPRQPGARNWLWLRNELAGGDRALSARSLADLLEALAADGPPLAVRTSSRRGDRVGLEVRPIAGLPGLGQGLPGLISEVAAPVTGRIPVMGLDLALRSHARERELAWRLLPGLPSSLQLAWAGLMLAGLLGLAEARRWFGRIWPPEERAEYSRVSGWHAARAVRSLMFWAAFLPLAGLPALVARCAMLLLAPTPGAAGSASPAGAVTSVATGAPPGAPATVGAATRSRDA